MFRGIWWHLIKVFFTTLDTSRFRLGVGYGNFRRNRFDAYSSTVTNERPWLYILKVCLQCVGDRCRDLKGDPRKRLTDHEVNAYVAKRLRDALSARQYNRLRHAYRSLEHVRRTSTGYGGPKKWGGGQRTQGSRDATHLVPDGGEGGGISTAVLFTSRFLSDFSAQRIHPRPPGSHVCRAAVLSIVQWRRKGTAKRPADPESTPDPFDTFPAHSSHDLGTTRI